MFDIPRYNYNITEYTKPINSVDTYINQLVYLHIVKTNLFNNNQIK